MLSFIFSRVESFRKYYIFRAQSCAPGMYNTGLLSRALIERFLSMAGDFSTMKSGKFTDETFEKQLLAKIKNA